MVYGIWCLKHFKTDIKNVFLHIDLVLHPPIWCAYCRMYTTPLGRPSMAKSSFVPIVELVQVHPLRTPFFTTSCMTFHCSSGHTLMMQGTQRLYVLGCRWKLTWLFGVMTLLFPLSRPPQLSCYLHCSTCSPLSRGSLLPVGSASILPRARLALWLPFAVRELLTFDDYFNSSHSRASCTNLRKGTPSLSIWHLRTDTWAPSTPRTSNSTLR